MNRGAASTEAMPRPAPARALGRAGYVVALGALLLALPFIPQVPPFQRILLSYGLIAGITALAFNLLLGYTGLLSFGHSAFFGTAAYTAAFLVRYLHLTSMEAYLAAGFLSSLVVAVVFGVVCVRYTRIFFSILALALSQVLWGLAIKLFWITGGTDGIRVPSPTLLFGLIGGGDDKLTFLATTYYYYVLAVFALCVGALWLIVHSPFGKALQAIRDNEVRAEFVGVPVRTYRLAAFVLSGAFTGVAGALWAPLNGHVTPDVLYWPFSGRIVFMTVLGGFKSFGGPLIGALVFNHLEAYAVGYATYWQAVLGVVLVLLVLLMPTGLVGAGARLVARLRRS
jgi:branched-chain amino acid transport system permease protein